MAIHYGTSFVGFICVPESKRYITAEKAGFFIGKIKKQFPNIQTVVVTRAKSEQEVMDLVKATGCHLIQIHSDMSAAVFNQISFPHKIKVCRIRSAGDFSGLDQFDAEYFLFDTFREGIFGGTGEKFNWNWIPRVLLSKSFIAGGLEIADIPHVVGRYKPFALDMNSGLELYPGIKSPAKIQQACRRLKQANRTEGWIET